MLPPGGRKNEKKKTYNSSVNNMMMDSEVENFRLSLVGHHQQGTRHNDGHGGGSSITRTAGTGTSGISSFARGGGGLNFLGQGMSRGPGGVGGGAFCNPSSLVNGWFDHRNNKNSELPAAFSLAGPVPPPPTAVVAAHHRPKEGGGRKITKVQERDEDEEDDDPLLARELAALSIQERQLLFDEINGTAGLFPEEPDMIEEKLVELEIEIQKLRHRSAYNRAHFLAPRRVKDRDFRLMFLRSERYDAIKSAKRIVKHFEYKQMLFGSHKVAKDITLNDLNERDKQRLESGASHILPCTDTAGRAVMLMLERNNHNPKYNITTKDESHQDDEVGDDDDSSSTISWESHLRVIWYQAMAAVKGNVNTQRRGFVFISYNVDIRLGQQKQRKLHLIPKIYIIRDGLPWRPASVHFCYDDPKIRAIFSLLSSVGGTEARLRIREHFGSHQECQYELMKFGIAPGLLPLDSSGEYLDDDFLKYLEDRKRKEEEKEQAEQARMNNTIPAISSYDAEPAVESSMTTPYQTDYARQMDVILGRGKPFQDHTGNLQLATYIEENRPEYVKADRLGKTCISWRIVQQVKASGGRFLKMDETTEYWVEVDDSMAREKVAHGFRTRHKGSNTSMGGGSTGGRSGRTSKLFSCQPSSSSNEEEDGGDKDNDDEIIMDTMSEANKRMKH